MKTSAHILIFVALVNLIGGIFFGMYVISESNQPWFGGVIIFSSIMFNFGLLALAEIGINIAAIRNVIELHAKTKGIDVSKPTLLNDEQLKDKNSSDDWECSKCGASISDDAIVCPGCGADVSEIED